MLQVSVNAVDERYRIEFEKLEARRWTDISNNLATHMRHKKYTAKACRERYDGLLSGTAELPIEIDGDQEGRRLRREARITANKRRRAEEMNAAREEAEEKAQIARERNAVKEARSRELIAKRSTTIKAKQEKEKYVRDKAQRMAAVQAARKKAQAKARVEVEWKRRQIKAERALYKRLTGQRLLAGGRVSEAVRKGKGKEQSPRNANSEADSDEDEGHSTDDEPETPDGDTGKNSSSKKKTAGKSKSTPTANITHPAAADATPPPPPPPVTEESLQNPRSIMNDHELKVLLYQRRGHLAPRRPDETHPQLIARLAAADNSLKEKELNELLRAKFLVTKGTKKEKILRLQEADAEESFNGKDIVRATDRAFMEQYVGYMGEFSYLLQE
jgi:hypothetical protein